MTDIIIRGGSLSGSVRAPPSKSYTHRAIIAASLSSGLSKVYNALICDDTQATIEACQKIGAEVSISGDGTLRIIGSPKPKTPDDVINCRDSGSTIRFMTPICALADGITVLTGGRSLRNRPMGPLLDALSQLGVRCYSARGDGRPPIIVFGGGIRGGRAAIRGDVSSQFITGLLFASPMAENDTSIVLSTPLESRPYVDMSLNILKRHGINVKEEQESFHIPSGQEYKPHDHYVEGDYSSASFLLAAAAITRSRVRVENLLRDSLQGDRFIVKILSDVGAEVKIYNDSVEVAGSREPLNPVNVDLRDNPDLAPVCAVLACVAKGTSVISGVRRLRFKESDRIEALREELSKMDADIKVLDDKLVIKGASKLKGAEIDPHGDHRIAMACAVAALVAEGETIIHNAECINKSYPDFIRDMRLLGVEVLER